MAETTDSTVLNVLTMVKILKKEATIKLNIQLQLFSEINKRTAKNSVVPEPQAILLK